MHLYWAQMETTTLMCIKNYHAAILKGGAFARLDT